MKTIKSNSISKSNMHSSQKKTPASESKNRKEQTSGKKLVQARLPFKIIPGAETSAALRKSDLSKPESLPKKRKLSYTEECENPTKIGKSDSKENVKNDKVEAAVVDVIVVEDNDSDSALQLSPKTPVSSSESKKLNKSTPRSAESKKTPKMQIKLPLSGKKKRKLKRSSKVSKCEESDCSDVEVVENLDNSVKKPKIADNESCKDTFKDKSDKGSNVSKVVITKIEKTPTLKKENDAKGKKEKSNLPEDKIEIVVQESAANVSENPTNLNTIEKEPEEKPTMSQKQQQSDTDVGGVKKFPTETNHSIIEVTESKPSRRSLRQSENIQIDEERQKSEVESLSEAEKEKSNGPDSSFSNEAKNKLLTPKQLKRMEQRKIAQEEKERKLQQLKEEKERKLQEQREERERKAQEEKMLKQKEREEREVQRKREREEKDEQKRREKEEKEEQRRKEREDKERKRLAEVEAKNEEKRKKDEVKEEERRKKEEERRRKELEKEEEENKKKKAAQAFTKFFVPKVPKPSPDDDPESRDDSENPDSLAFRPFQVKGDMKLAPLVRRVFSENARGKLDSFLNGVKKNSRSDLYIDELKLGKHTPLKGLRTVLKDNEDDIIIVENELETAAQTIDEARPKLAERFKAKFYSFRENRRPPFYGTWRKKSKVITARRPFAVDKNFFDYEVDSDDEWEEEEPGESLNGSDDEKDESEDEDYEVDNEWFVPHGHLSDEELQNEDEVGPDTSREAQKAKLKALQQEFAKEMKKKTEKIKPRLIGAIWENEEGKKPNLCPSVIWDSLYARAMIICEQPIIEEPETPESDPSPPPPEKLKRIQINDDLMRDLVRLVHGNRHSKAFLIKEYIEYVSKKCDTIRNGECLAPIKAVIQKKIDEISEWSVVSENSSKKKNKKKLCWVVSSDVLDKYSLGQLVLRNEWSYTLQPKYSNDTHKLGNVSESEKQNDSVAEIECETPKIGKKKSNVAAITKFAKILTKEEKQNQLSATMKASSNSPKTERVNRLEVPQKSENTHSKKQPQPALSRSNKSTSVKKRVAILMSVPPGQEFSPQSKNALISNFLQKNKSTSNSGDRMDVEDEVIRIE